MAQEQEEMKLYWQFSLTSGPAGYLLWMDGRPAYECAGYMSALIKMQELVAGLMRDTLHAGDVTAAWGDLPTEEPKPPVVGKDVPYEQGEPVIVREGVAVRTVDQLIGQFIQDSALLLGLDLDHDLQQYVEATDDKSELGQFLVEKFELLLATKNFMVEWDDGYIIYYGEPEA